MTSVFGNSFRCCDGMVSVETKMEPVDWLRGGKYHKPGLGENKPNNAVRCPQVACNCANKHDLYIFLYFAFKFMSRNKLVQSQEIQFSFISNCQIEA